jgi:hypothetical protein
MYNLLMIKSNDSSAAKFMNTIYEYKMSYKSNVKKHIESVYD